MPDELFWRDAAGRLSFQLFCVPPTAYPALSAELVGAFRLAPRGLRTASWEAVFREYESGAAVVGLDWDHWTGFTVVARSRDAEALVRDIAAYLLASPRADGSAA